MAKIEIVDGPSAVAPVYFDSALIAKFYLNEPGRDAVRALAKRAGVVTTSGIAVGEIAAAFHRKFREGAVDQQVFTALQGQFQHDLRTGLWRLSAPTDALLEEVRALFCRLEPSVFLRALDGLHLVTAKAEGFHRIYSNDRHLIAASASVGLEGVNPIAESRPGSPSRRPPRVRKNQPRDRP